jgi:hypothetical protein
VLTDERQTLHAGRGQSKTSRVRTGTGTQALACLRNLAIGVLSRTGPATPLSAQYRPVASR